MTNRQVLKLLRAYESRNVTFVDPQGGWPIVWERAKGVHVWDAEGKKYLDLTAAFGVAAAGHANPQVVRAGQKQMARLLHAMGDVHPHRLKAELARELSRITFERWSRKTGKSIFCNSGFEAVEAALKTALLATGKRGVIAFTGAYHGLGYGALNATHRELFRTPFLAQIGRFAQFVPFPEPERTPEESLPLSLVEKKIRHLFRGSEIGAILVEPVQGRAGIRVPPAEFLPLLRRLADEHNALLIVDEIYTGFGRTGRWFACEHTKTVPDLICLGKALAGGFPISACVGRADLMDRTWPETRGEALHTSTFLGHPVGCAMALAQIAVIKNKRLVNESARKGEELLRALRKIGLPRGMEAFARGLGLMVGLELLSNDGTPASAATWKVVKAMLKQGYIVLPEGEHGNVISFTPPLTISSEDLLRAVGAVQEAITFAKPS